MTRTADLDSLPVKLAIRLALDSVSYSNPLPDWFEPLTINHSSREDLIRRKIHGYAGGAQPRAPFQIHVPKKSGQLRGWAVPTVNDQIVCQTYVSSIAQVVEQGAVDRSKVYSCRCNNDPDRLAFLEDQVSAWREFQVETERRAQAGQSILQIDIENAFSNIDRTEFFEFLRGLLPGRPEVDLLRSMIEALAGSRPGLPLVNDSVFFLGNAYLSRVDKLVGRYTANFTRFVDDYRLFGDSQSNLEILLGNVSRDLREIGFRINPHKLKLGTGEEYLDSVAKSKYAESTGSLYIDAAIFSDIIRPEVLLGQVKRTVTNPDQYMTEGFGRLELGALRRMRANALVAHAASYSSSPRDDFSQLLTQDSALVAAIVQLLRKCSNDPTALWRSIWLLYLTKDIDRSARVRDASRAIQHSSGIPEVVRLWASEMPQFPDGRKWTREVDELHDLDYLHRGIRCYGGGKGG